MIHQLVFKNPNFLLLYAKCNWFTYSRVERQQSGNDRTNKAS